MTSTLPRCGLVPALPCLVPDAIATPLPNPDLDLPTSPVLIYDTSFPTAAVKTSDFFLASAPTWQSPALLSFSVGAHARLPCFAYEAGYPSSSSCTAPTRVSRLNTAPDIFRLRTNASPVYLVLFISATYFLNRPCVYCSLLLFILVVALFDFSTPWFEAPLASETAELALNGTTPFRDSIFETAGVFVQAANKTAQSLVRSAIDGIREKGVEAPEISNGANYEWVKGLVGKKEWRIPCLDVLVRI